MRKLKSGQGVCYLVAITALVILIVICCKPSDKLPEYSDLAIKCFSAIFISMLIAYYIDIKNEDW